MYLLDPISEVVRPWKRLAGFTKVELGPGESRMAEVELLRDDVAMHDEAMVDGTMGEASSRWKMTMAQKLQEATQPVSSSQDFCIVR